MQKLRPPKERGSVLATVSLTHHGAAPHTRKTAIFAVSVAITYNLKMLLLFLAAVRKLIAIVCSINGRSYRSATILAVTCRRTKNVVDAWTTRQSNLVDPLLLQLNNDVVAVKNGSGSNLCVQYVIDK